MAPREIIKSVALTLFVVLAALGVSYSFTQVIFVQSGSWFLWLIIWAIIFGSLTILQGFFTKGYALPAILIAFEVTALGGFFIGNYSILRAAALIIVWLILFFGTRAAASEMANTIKIRFFRVAGLIMNYTTRALALFITVFYLSFLAFQDPGVIKSHIISTGQFTPGFSFEQTLDDVLDNFSSDSREGSGSILSSLINIPELNGETREAAGGQIEQTLSNIVGVRVRLSDSVGDIVYNVATDKLAGLSPQAKTALWIIAGILVYLTIRFILFITGWLAILIAFILYYLLLTFHFFHVSFEQRNKEIVSL